MASSTVQAPPPIAMVAGLASSLPPLLMTSAIAGGEAVTAVYGAGLGTIVQAVLVGVLGLIYLVYVHEHHATKRALDSSAAAVAAAKVAASVTGPGIDNRILSVVHQEVPKLLGDITGPLEHLVSSFFPPVGASTTGPSPATVEVSSPAGGAPGAGDNATGTPAEGLAGPAAVAPPTAGAGPT